MIPRDKGWAVQEKSTGRNKRGFSRSQFDGGPKDNHSTRPANALRLIHFELFFFRKEKKKVMPITICLGGRRRQCPPREGCAEEKRAGPIGGGGCEERETSTGYGRPLHHCSAVMICLCVRPAAKLMRAGRAWVPIKNARTDSNGVIVIWPTTIVTNENSKFAKYVPTHGADVRGDRQKTSPSPLQTMHSECV